MTRIDNPPPSNLPPPTQARHAEHSDTRQDIQRHEPEFYKKKKDKGEQGTPDDPYEDLTDVSVPALKNFLMGLLDRMQKEAAVEAANMRAATETIRPPASPHAAAAMSAYAKRSGPAAPPPPPPPSLPPIAEQQQTAGSALDQAAANLDRPLVLELIRDLDRLAAEGIHAIALEKGESFLLSIRAAIDGARAKAAGR